MAPLSAFLSAAFTLALTTGAPAPVPEPLRAVRTKEGYTLTQVPVNPGYLRSGTHAIFRTYKRYGIEPPQHVILANAAQNNTVAASPEQYDSMYLTPIKVGSTGKTLKMDIDTGSADLWTFSSSMPRSELSGRPYYDPTQSSTSKRLSGAMWEIQYGDGTTASGDVFTDTVSLANVTAPAQAIQAATQVSESFLEDPDCDGLMGLAFSQINTVSPTPQKTFFDNVKSSLKDPLFAVDLRKGAAGSYQFGAVDQGKFTGAITYAPVNQASRGFWQFTAAGYAIGDGDVTMSPISAVADTGSSTMYMPSSIVEEYYKQVDGAKNDQSLAGWVFPCSASLPDFTIRIGGHSAKVPGSFINFAPAQDGSDECFGGIQEAVGTPFAILGDVFLKAQYVVFNGSNPPMIGFADKQL